MQSVNVIYNNQNLSGEGDFEKIIYLIEKIIEALGQEPSYQARMQYEPEAESFTITLDCDPIALLPTQKDTIMEYDVQILDECGADTNPLLSYDITYNIT
jgi:hypothetical protein